MSDVISLIKWGIDIIRGRAKDEKADRLRLEQDAWQWLERHLPYFEEEACKVYSIVLQSSAQNVPVEFPNEQYPYVEKISRFPPKIDNALNINFRKMEKKNRQRVWAISKNYIDKWNDCLQKFPNGAPELPHDIAKFERTRQILHVIISKN